jgi:hypothetical protein
MIQKTPATPATPATAPEYAGSSRCRRGYFVAADFLPATGLTKG